MAFDPAFTRDSAGSEALYSAFEDATNEGVTRAEFLGAATSHKQRFSDRVEPIYQGIGLARTVRGRLGARALVAGIHVRRRARTSETAPKIFAHVPRALMLLRPLPPTDR